MTGEVDVSSQGRVPGELEGIRERGMPWLAAKLAHLKGLKGQEFLESRKHLSKEFVYTSKTTRGAGD
jgi:hypothetical protein